MTLLDPAADGNAAADPPPIQPAEPPRSGAPGVSLVPPSIVYAVLFGAIGAYVPYIAVFFGDIGLGLETIGALSALSAAVALVAAPAWGAVADRARDVRVPVLLAAFWSAAAGAWLATSTDALSAALAISALSAGTAGLAPMLDSRTVEILGADRDRFGRARAWGSAGFIVIALATGLVIDRLGPGASFYVSVPGILAAGIAAWILLRGGPTRSKVRIATARTAAILDIIRSRELGAFFGMSVLLWTAVTAVITFVSIHLIALGGDGQLIGALWALGALVEVPLMFLFPVLVRRTTAERLLVIGAAAFAIRALGWALAPAPLLLVAIAPIGGIGFAFTYVGTVMVVSRKVPASVQATAQGLFSGTAMSIGSILGATLGGQLAETTSIQVTFAVAAAVTGLAAVGISLALGRGTQTSATTG